MPAVLSLKSRNYCSSWPPIISVQLPNPELQFHASTQCVLQIGENINLNTCFTKHCGNTLPALYSNTAGGCRSGDSLERHWDGLTEPQGRLYSLGSVGFAVVHCSVVRGCETLYYFTDLSSSFSVHYKSSPGLQRCLLWGRQGKAV